MVVLAVAIVSKGGKPLLSRQFRPLPKSRIDSLLASFPKLIPAGSQHTTVENADVRFVYQPFDEVYVLVMTNKGSNILQDISTLSLTVRLITSLLPAMSEPAILANSFELLCAFDEVVSLGYKENASLQQIRNVLEGESHEEKIQEIIARNKEAEAKEELKRRAKQLEMQRREQQRFNQSSGARPYSSANSGGQGNVSSGQATSSYAPPVTRSDQVSFDRSNPRSQSPAVVSKPVFKGSGMKLGRKVKQTEFLEAMGGEAVESDPIEANEELGFRSSVPLAEDRIGLQTDVADSLPDVQITIRETFSLLLSRDGELKAFDAKGDMDLRINNGLYSKVKVHLSDLDQRYLSPGYNLQLQQHPNVVKFSAASPETVIQLKDPNKSFPVGQGLGVLRWRLSTKSDSAIPLIVNCWTAENSNGTFTVNLEYALNAPELYLPDVVLTAPLGTGLSRNVSASNGTWSVSDNCLVWRVPEISVNDPEGTIEFTCEASNAASFFPIDVSFTCATSLCGIKVGKVATISDDQSVPAKVDIISSPTSYRIV